MKIVNTIKTILLLSVVVILPSCLDLDPQDQMIINCMLISFMNGLVIFRVPYMMVLIVIPVRT